MGLVGELMLLNDELVILGEGTSIAEVASDPPEGEEGTNETAPETEPIARAQIQDISTSLAIVIMALDEKRCLQEVMNHSDVVEMVEHVNSRRQALLNGGSAQQDARVQLAFSRLAAWQDSLVALGAKMVDRDELYPRDLQNEMTCPRPCNRCTFEHGGIFKGVEKDRFKCILGSVAYSNPPSDSRLKCSKPVRRTWKFWEYKSWCEVPGWIAEAYQNARISAMVTCGIHSLTATLKTNATMTDDLLRICMLVEQQMVVSLSELTTYRDWMSKTDDGVVPQTTQHAFGAFLTLATADGLVGIRDTASVLPPAENETWESVLEGIGYTLLPPAVVDSVPCNPPINNWEVFIGGFAAVAGIGAAVMLGTLASIPLALVSGFFFVLAGLVLLSEVTVVSEQCILARCHGNADAAQAVAQLGLVTAAAIPQFFVTVFAKSSVAVRNALLGDQTAKPCPRGLLVIPGTAPICLSDMEKLEAKRYSCPADESRSTVVTCEPEFNGVITIRGSPC